MTRTLDSASLVTFLVEPLLVVTVWLARTPTMSPAFSPLGTRGAASRRSSRCMPSGRSVVLTFLALSPKRAFSNVSPGTRAVLVASSPSEARSATDPFGTTDLGRRLVSTLPASRSAGEPAGTG